jgi:signal transduction histidine kinase
VRLNRQAEATTGGSGIGLSVVRELVTLHGGRTRAEGAPGGGARIVIELPLTHADDGIPTPQQPPSKLKAVP